MTDVKMPEPTYIWHEDRDDETSCEMYEVAVSGLVDTNDEIYANGKCNLCTRLFTEAQMLQFRRDALEEAALLVEADLWPGPVHAYQKDYNAGVKSLAKKVRKLKDET